MFKADFAGGNGYGRFLIDAMEDGASCVMFTTIIDTWVDGASYVMNIIIMHTLLDDTTTVTSIIYEMIRKNIRVDKLHGTYVQGVGVLIQRQDPKHHHPYPKTGHSALEMGDRGVENTAT